MLLSWIRACQLILDNFYQHEKALHALANALLEYETLTAEEIKRVLLPCGEGQMSEQQRQQVEEEELALA